MSKRHRPRGGQLTKSSPRPEIERLSEKGRAKGAFKLAKVGFRDDPSAENRQLLELDLNGLSCWHFQPFYPAIGPLAVDVARRIE